MKNDNLKSEPKKGFPGGFFIFLLAAVLIFLTVQNLSSEKTAKVSFSHQVEHLVNLDLIQKEDNRKIALNDNLVTFTGRFKDRQTDDAKAHYRYLELLERNHELVGQKMAVNSELDALKVNVSDSADLFLHLSGISIPKGGYKVVDPVYDNADKENAIVIKKLSDKDFVTLADLNASLATLAATPEAVGNFSKDLLRLVEGYRSHALGIGNETMKQELKNIEQQISESTNKTPAEQLPLFKQSLAELSKVTQELNRDQQNMRLLPLRSVRNYKAQIEQYNYISEELEKNDAQLDKARQSVANVTWYFNNQELSTRALEKQDSEVYAHWFAQAKHEWELFPTNKAALFKAPDQPRNLVLEKTFKSEEPSSKLFKLSLYDFASGHGRTAALFRLLKTDERGWQ